MTSAAGQLTRLFAMQGLRIDESTAMYYLKESGGDLKKAVKLFGEPSFLPQLSPHCFPLLLLLCSHKLAAVSQDAAQQAYWSRVVLHQKVMALLQRRLSCKLCFSAGAESDKTWDHRA